MADPKCPDCGHPTRRHSAQAGCTATKPGHSGKPAACPCTRVFRS